MKNSNNYDPKPIELKELPASLSAVAEEIAKAVHDSWAKEKMAQGYVYGETRNDDPAAGLKTHPMLKPYEELSNDEQELDRATARTTIAMLTALGYRIEKA